MEVSGAGKAWNDRRFFYWIYLASDASAQAKWLHNLTLKKKYLVNHTVRLSLIHYEKI